MRAVTSVLAMLAICASARAGAQEAAGVAATGDAPALPQFGFGLPALGARVVFVEEMGRRPASQTSPAWFDTLTMAGACRGASPGGGAPQAPLGEACVRKSEPASPDALSSSKGEAKEDAGPRFAGAAKLLAGGAIGLAAHEAAHLVFDYTFDASPGIKRVSFGPLPFFAITHEAISPRREFIVSSAGFWVQQLGNEVLLSRRPELRGERAPIAKGLFAFNVTTSAAYAAGAFAHAGPAERDTRSMAAFLGIDEAAVGTMLLAPAVLDAVRHYRPEASWAKWASRAAKVGMVLLVVKRGH